MRQTSFLFVASAFLFSCEKSTTHSRPPRTITDTLMLYSQQTLNGKSNILLKSFKSGQTQTLINSASHSFATNLRIVYIKSGNTLGFAKLDGVSRLLLPLTQPREPSLSFDSRLICVVDKLPDKYQLIRYDTLGSKITLYETTDEISSPSFSSDGEKIVFTQKSANSSSLFLISVTGGAPKRITPFIAGSYDEYGTVRGAVLYFVRSRTIDSTLSSEIFSSDLGGVSITPLSNFTNNWTTPSFFIKHLRKISTDLVDSSSLICVSNYNNTNSDVYMYKIGGGLTKMTETNELESYPSLIPNIQK
jgi:Tol biopolymer transport system component